MTALKDIVIMLSIDLFWMNGSMHLSKHIKCIETKLSSSLQNLNQRQMVRK